jgi:hypothetical protein
MGTRAHADSTTFSGQATAVRATLLGTTTTLADTGPLPSSGGALEASLLSASVDGLLTADVLHAATIGQGDRSRSEASLADVSVTVAGNTLTADFLMARAMAVCGPSVSGSSEIVNLVINGQTIAITGQPNQTVNLPGGVGAKVVINEQLSSIGGNSGSIDVNALHVIVPLVADVVISHAHADIICQGQPNCNTSNDFVTGGGWITTSGAKGTFGVAGGVKNGALWGHLEYIDHGTGMKVHGTGVTAYTVTGTTSREIQGTAEVNGQSGFTYTVDVADNSDPGKGSDTFGLRLSNGYTAWGTLGGGNIQLHKPCQ